MSTIDQFKKALLSVGFDRSIQLPALNYKKYEGCFWWFGIAVFATTMTFVVYSPTAQSWLLKWATVISGFGTVILTFFLVLLYRQQKELLAADQSPFIEVDDYNPKEGRLQVYLSNAGKGVATNLELVTVSIFSNLDNVGPGIAAYNLTRESNSSDVKRRGRTLQPAEECIGFNAIPLIGFRIGGPDKILDRATFNTAMSRLRGEEPGIIRIHFYIRYQDLLGNYHIKHFSSMELEMTDEDPSFEEAYNSAAPMLWGEPEVSADSLQFSIKDAEAGNRRTVI